MSSCQKRKATFPSDFSQLNISQLQLPGHVWYDTCHVPNPRMMDDWSTPEYVTNQEECVSISGDGVTRPESCSNMLNTICVQHLNI